MSVYLITASSEGLAKIGYASRPRARLYNLRIGSPVHLVLAAVIPGSRQNEQELHARFSKERVHGEWFKINGEIARLICDYRVSAQSQRPRSRKPSAAVPPFDASANERWLRAYGELASLGRPVSRAAIDRFMATYRPDAKADAA